jgi:F-type H+-transporting ATPase subunit gamma
MPALIDLRRRIKSVQNTQQITQAMKSVATAKFQKAQKSVLEGRPHWHNFPKLAAKVVSWAGAEKHPLLQKREEKRVVGLVITSDKGLCGAFNSNLLTEAQQFFTHKSTQADVRLVLMGKKAVAFFDKQDFPKDRIYRDRIHKLTPQDLEELAEYMMRLYALNQTDAVYAVYNEFKSILAPRVSVTKLLPLEPQEAVTAESEFGQIETGPDIEPPPPYFLDAFLSRHVVDQMCHFFHESQAAEQAARMMAMDNATNNAGDLIHDLTLVLNKVRQASITKELLEIMTAVEALGKK